MMLYYNTVIVLSGVSLLGALAGLVGAFAVLRKRSLTGDALAHAALPGVCLGYLVVGERFLPALLLGALLSGVLGIVTINLLTTRTRIREDAAIGSVLGAFFGVGIALSKWIQRVSRDGGQAGLDSFLFGKAASMSRADVIAISLIALFCVMVILLLYKQFKLISFDADFGHTLGWPVRWLDLALMSLLALTVVIGLPAVGVVLTAALVIIPGAAARFWTERFGSMLLLSTLFGFLMAFAGTLPSAYVRDLPTGPAIVLAGAVIFVVSLLAGVRRGIVARWLRSRQFEAEVNRRRLLAGIWELQGAEPQLPSVRSADLLKRQTWSPSRLNQALSLALQAGEIQPAADGFQLTERGKKLALAIIRTHLLWKELLQEQPEQASAIADLTAPLAEQVQPEVIARIEQTLRERGQWPELPEVGR
jgi:manganese/zinc/iron transport system permease protein